MLDLLPGFSGSSLLEQESGEVQMRDRSVRLPVALAREADDRAIALLGGAQLPPLSEQLPQIVVAGERERVGAERRGERLRRAERAFRLRELRIGSGSPQVWVAWRLSPVCCAGAQTLKRRRRSPT